MPQIMVLDGSRAFGINVLFLDCSLLESILGTIAALLSEDFDGLRRGVANDETAVAVLLAALSYAHKSCDLPCNAFDVRTMALLRPLTSVLWAADLSGFPTRMHRADLDRGDLSQGPVDPTKLRSPTQSFEGCRGRIWWPTPATHAAEPDCDTLEVR